SVDRIAVEDLDQSEIGKVAIQGSSRTLAGFLQRMNRKLEWNSASVTDPGLHALCQDKVMPIARNEVASSLGNPDDRPSRLKFLPRQAVVEETLEVKGGHIRVLRVILPCLAPELRPVVSRHFCLLPFDQIFQKRAKSCMERLQSGNRLCAN